MKIDKNRTILHYRGMHVQNPALLPKLQSIGLSDKEAKVYLCLLELGGAFPSRIAEYTAINRSTVYKILLDLGVRGIVSEIEKRKKLFYQAERPVKVLRYAKEQVQLAEEKLERAKMLLPDMEGLYSLLGDRPKITYYEGEEGILSIYKDHVSVSRPYEMVAWAHAAGLLAFLPASFFDTYVREKQRNKITTRGILPDTQDNRRFTSLRYSGVPPLFWPKVRFLEEHSFPLRGEITVYGENKVSILNFEKEKMVGMIIEDKAIHGMFVAIFNTCWESKMVKE